MSKAVDIPSTITTAPLVGTKSIVVTFTFLPLQLPSHYHSMPLIHSGERAALQAQYESRPVLRTSAAGYQENLAWCVRCVKHHIQYDPNHVCWILLGQANAHTAAVTTALALGVFISYINLYCGLRTGNRGELLRGGPRRSPCLVANMQLFSPSTVASKGHGLKNPESTFRNEAQALCKISQVTEKFAVRYQIPKRKSSQINHKGGGTDYLSSI